MVARPENCAGRGGPCGPEVRIGAEWGEGPEDLVALGHSLQAWSFPDNEFLTSLSSP